MKKVYLYIIVSFISTQCVLAQNLTDGLMMPKKDFCTGVIYSTDSWKNYWEGSLKRDNQNLGTVTTNNAMWMGSYGITPKLNVIAMLPYVWTKASGGTLHPMAGLQDVTIGAKYRFVSKDFENSSFKAFAVGSFSIPTTNYTPDFLPLSIGLASKTFTARLNAVYSLKKTWYASISTAYVFRSNIFLDRASYFTDGQLYLTNEVAMPNQFLFSGSLGYTKNALRAELTYAQQNTLGGGDIRRQDMPFASNQMNFIKAGVMVMYQLPMVKNLAARATTSYTVAGRNVGQSTTYTAGLLYTFHFSPQQN